MVATIIDVAKKCGYSKATVSRAFASPEAVSERAKARIYAAANELNYTPNPIARAMARQKTDNITFVIHENQYPAILNPFYSSALEAIMQETMKRNYGLFVTTNDHVRLPSGEVSIKKHMDGVIIAGQTDRSSIESFCKQNIPVVVLNNLIQMEHLPCIAVDNYHGAKCAAEHLIQKGHRRIALLEGRFSPQIYHDRHNGYMDAIVSAGLTYDTKVNPKLSIRRLTITANRLVGEDTAQQEPEAPVQFNLFDNIEVQEQRLQEEVAQLERERKIQEAMLGIKKKFGKNAILNGGSYLEGATAKERNKQIGGHKA